MAVLWHRAVREPFPERLVGGLPLHLKRKEPAFCLVDGEYAHPLRVGPLEPQQFSNLCVSVSCVRAFLAVRIVYQTLLVSCPSNHHINADGGTIAMSEES